MPNSPTSPDPYGDLRELSHERTYQLWQAAKLGDYFEGDYGQLVQAMCDHPEYREAWDHVNEFGQEQMTIDGTNPLMHVAMHTAIENQAAQDNPPEVRAVLAFKTSHQVPRHEAVHEVANEFALLLWQALHDRRRFDNEAYRRRLDKLLPRSRRTRK